MDFLRLVHGIRLRYLQNLETSAVANTFWYRTTQAIVFNITASNGSSGLQQMHELKSFKRRMPVYETYKYHNPVSWHISGESEPCRLLPRSPLFGSSKISGSQLC